MHQDVYAYLLCENEYGTLASQSEFLFSLALYSDLNLALCFIPRTRVAPVSCLYSQLTLFYCLRIYSFRLVLRIWANHLQSHGAEPPPSPKWWRCELTALSHCFNLYFIAYNDTIHVYQPSFPRQELANKPDLILHPPVSSPMLEPAIDLADPHSITRLHVDYLGREEILLVTCDDGDVIGYRVPEIYRVVESRRDSMYDESNPDLEDRVRIFLHQNVGASAWGLAVHREARLIAISANTHQVTVLALALSKPPTDPDIPPALDSSLSSENDDQDFPHSRWRGTIIILHASANIPAVFFDNSGRDPAGRWLFSSSIDGANQLWDLHEVEQVRTFEDGAVTIHAAPSCIGLAPVSKNHTSPGTISYLSIITKIH